jgi:hypothetical protein
MSKVADRLIAVDGVNGAALITTARALASEQPPRRAAISTWDASGIFGEVQMAETDAGRPCARTLLLLYAADLAFRLRWEIRPALAAGRLVVAAPYVDTAVAFGRAAGMDAGWLADLFAFAPEAGRHVEVSAAAARTVAERRGFLEFSIQQAIGAHASAARLELLRRATLNLKSLARQHASAAGSRTAAARSGATAPADSRPARMLSRRAAPRGGARTRRRTRGGAS